MCWCSGRKKRMSDAAHSHECCGLIICQDVLATLECPIRTRKSNASNVQSLITPPPPVRVTLFVTMEGSKSVRAETWEAGATHIDKWACDPPFTIRDTRTPPNP